MKVLVIGASGVVGAAAARALSAGDCEIVGVSRSTDPPVDTTDQRSIAALFERIGQVDAVVCAAGSIPFKPLAELTHDDFVTGYFGKAQAQFDVVAIGTPYVRDGGSFTLTTGILAREPIRTGAAASAMNGAVESFVMAAACELPRGVRINAVSPSVLAEAPGFHSAFPGFEPVPAASVGQLFVKSVAGVATGRVFGLDRP